MGLTKRKLAALIKRKLDGGMGLGSKYDERDIFLYIDAAIAQTIGMEHDMLGRKRIALSEYYHEELAISSDWVKSFHVKLKYNCDRREAYVTLPATMISLRDDAGLRQLSFIEGQETPFIIQPQGARGVFYNLEASDLGENYVCYLEENKIYIPEYPEAELCTLLLKMVCGTDGYTKDEPMNYPSALESDIIQNAYLLALSQVPEKKNNDGNSASR